MLDIERDYFNWLCDLVHIDQGHRSYWIVARDLWRKEFVSYVDHDENRGYDGLELRDEFLSEGGMPNYGEIDGECSVLEMMIALARRMDFETSDPYDDEYTMDRTSFWFWEMMDNLGLLKFDDDSYVQLDGQTYVDTIIDNLVERRYRRDGRGGLFPLVGECEDQREIEIWYQMAAYLAEVEGI